MRNLFFVLSYTILSVIAFSYEIIGKSYEENPENLLKTVAIDVDNSGNVYLVDYLSGKILILDANYKYKDKIVGLNFPSALTIEGSKGYISETGDNRVTIYDFETKIKKSYGSYGMVQGKFNHPGNLYKIGNEIYVVDEENFRIQIFSEKMEYIREMMLPKYKKNHKSVYNNNYGIAELQGKLYILDIYNKCVYIYSGRKMESKINMPASNAYDLISYSGKIYAFDIEKGIFYNVLNKNNKIEIGIKEKFSLIKFGHGKIKDGKYYFVSKNAVYYFDFKLKKTVQLKKLTIKNPEEYVEPCDVKKDGSGNIYILDKKDGRVIVYDKNWNYLREIIIGGESTGIWIDQFNNIYAAISGENKINKYNNNGEKLYSYGNSQIIKSKTAGEKESGNLKVMTDREGYIYVLDSLDYKLKKFDHFFNLKLETGKKAGVISVVNSKKENGSFGWDERSKDNLTDFFVYDEKSYILDNYYNRINVFENGKLTKVFEDNFSKNGLNGIYINNKKIYIADSYNFKIIIYSMDFKKLKEIDFLDKGLMPVKIYEELVICEKISDSFSKSYVIVKLKENER